MAAVNVNLGDLAGGLFKVIDKVWTSDSERDAAKLKVMELIQAGELAQVEVNKVEAAHESVFVAGWRPFIGWVCGVAYAYTFFIQPFLVFIAWAIGASFGVTLPLSTLPMLQLSELTTVLFGILGLGALRTYEKVTGTATPKPKG